MTQHIPNLGWTKYARSRVQNISRFQKNILTTVKILLIHENKWNFRIDFLLISLTGGWNTRKTWLYKIWAPKFGYLWKFENFSSLLFYIYGFGRISTITNSRYSRTKDYRQTENAHPGRVVCNTGFVKNWSSITAWQEHFSLSWSFVFKKMSNVMFCVEFDACVWMWNRVLIQIAKFLRETA